jgi:alanyl-tRNA synthetase
MKAAEIRSRFLEFFKNQGHSIIESSSLVPSNDPTLLFTTAGMVQFKDVFLNKDPRPYTRAASSQKCVRAGGKHNDLENVGFTARHHTFFEMLGNFSFGDYFKKEAIRFAWRFATEELRLPRERLYVTVFETDDEAADIWHHQEGVPRDRIYRFGEKDNFWAMGDTGPCGPCSELFIDRGEKYGCGKATCAMGCDCDRYMEFWNLVFMQYERDASGKLNPLPRPSVDTGAGLERIASILQDVETNYDTDLFQEIIARLSALAGVPYDRALPSAASFRVIADHARATTFLIGDGVLPSNEGRGYVLRRILRRAIRHGRKLGIDRPFLHEATGFVIDQMRDAYPDLVEKREFIRKATLAEEEQFLRTLDRGLALLDDEVARLAQSGGGAVLPGDVAFRLYDTFGFPLDLTRVICREKGLEVDEPGFERAMDHQRSESRKHWKGSGTEALDATYLRLAARLKEQGKSPAFVGYDRLEASSECVALLVQGENGLDEVGSFATPPLASTADSAEKTPIIEAVFAATPFYGESGGQVGDRGRVISALGASDFEAEVIDVQRPVQDLIVAHLRPKSGTIRVGPTYAQETDAELRALTARNHTGTHLLHWALREVLGKHVKQAGSLVEADLLRFDFTHFQPLTPGELQRIETLINERIWSGAPVLKREMQKDAAIAAGAIAMFGEKYADVVRVVSVGDFSTELCGGTHVERAGDIHLFAIASESGIAAGVRRIIAHTSKGAYEFLRGRDRLLQEARERLKAGSVEEVPGRIDRIQQGEKELRRRLDELQAKSAAGEVDELIRAALPLSGARLVSGVCAQDAQGIKRLRDIADRVKQKCPDAVAVLGILDPAANKPSLLIAVGPGAQGKFHANELLQRVVGLIDGRGGGKADLAQAGGTRSEGLEAAIAAARKHLAG